MRLLILIPILFSFLSLRAQAQLYPGNMDYMRRDAFNYYNPLTDSSNLNRKWSLHKYAGMSASYGFFNGGSAAVVSVPVGLQLNRRLNNNVYAFAGISAAPAFINFNSSFINPNAYKLNPGITMLNNGGLGMYSRFEAGLMYINDDKTFSISGSIGVQRSSYPPYPFYNGANFQKQQSPIGSRQ